MSDAAEEHPESAGRWILTRFGPPVVATLLILVPSWLIHAPRGWISSPEWLRDGTALVGFLLVIGGTCLALAVLRFFALRVFFVVVLVCLGLKENFPFSHFPMYSSFSDYSYVVFLADGEGEPVPVETLTSVRTSALKKNFKSNLDKIRPVMEKAKTWKGYSRLTMEQRAPAGKETLEWLVNSSKNEDVRKALVALKPLRLYMVEIRYEDGEIVRSEPGLVAELP